jgi:hypothetical protein
MLSGIGALIGWAVLLRNPLTLWCLVMSLAGFRSGVVQRSNRLRSKREWGSRLPSIMARTGRYAGHRLCIRNPGPRIAPHLRANQGRVLLPAASDSSSPGESESEDSRTSDSGTEDSGEGLASSVNDAPGMVVDSDDSDPPDMRGMSLLSWGSYAGCLDWFMSVGGSQRSLGF